MPLSSLVSIKSPSSNSDMDLKFDMSLVKFLTKYLDAPVFSYSTSLTPSLAKSSSLPSLSSNIPDETRYFITLTRYFLLL